MESSRHVCKLCNKRFACGRSLGGHMRSHLTNNLAADTNDEKQSKSSLQLANYMEEEKDLDSFGFGYGLRKNPKKTQKLEFLSEESSHNDKFCRECGKEFQSWKALFGHMKCHSSSFEEPDSLITDPKQKLVMDIQSDNEMEAPNKRKRSTTRRTITNSEVEQEQEVAISLMLLSMDVGNWVGFNSPAESSDNNSKFLESKTSVSYGCDEFVKSNKLKGKKMIKSHKFSSDMFLKSQRKTLAEFWDSKIYKKIPKKRSKFECDICYKIFDSYQALGGHRASHKKLKGCLVESAIEEEEVDSESSLEVAISESKLDNGGRREGEIGSRIPTKMNKHECPICERVFASGQALGGHKRSHLINGSEAKNRKAIVIQKQVPEIRGFLDLNLPPEAVERESKDHNLGSLKPWWVSASEHKHEALVNVGFHI